MCCLFIEQSMDIFTLIINIQFIALNELGKSFDTRLYCSFLISNCTESGRTDTLLIKTLIRQYLELIVHRQQYAQLLVQ